MPILTKAGCNAGACHAKAGNGQNGFRLSLLGFEPGEDYEHIVKEAHGRRVSPAAPAQSLLLLKATNGMPHGGGQRIDPKSESYQRILNWIGQGMPFRGEHDPQLASIEVQPPRALLQFHAQQQLKVLAHYSDGSQRDVTALALFEPNDKSMAETDEHGRVTIQEIPGNVAVMVRYQGLVSVCSAFVPLGPPLENLPPANNFVDELVFANLKQIGIPPSALCDDAEFLRRASLDIAGHLPTMEETRAFLDDQDADKRNKLIDSLLSSPGYADYFANKWSALLKNRRDATSDKTANFAFHSWLRDGLLENRPYDQMVRELLGATGDVVSNPPVAWYKRVKEPEQQLEDVAQLFLGVRMQCAQCHHHPFERWSQQDYYSLSAFFSQIGRKPTSTPEEDIIFHKRGTAQAENKKTKLPVPPAALGQTPQKILPDEDPRLYLADWMSTPENPFFAKALVNRYWKHFFKRGLIEPEDDIRDSNPPSNPELLDALARHFVESGYDLKSVIRAITRSRTYQLSSVPNELNGVDRQNYSRFYPRHLQSEVLLDAIDQFTGSQTDFPDVPRGTHAVSLPDNSYNKSSYFLAVFGRPDGASVCECERVQSSSLAQSLHLMNSQEMRQKLTLNGGRADQLSKDSRTDAEKVRDLYLMAFSRLPNDVELQATESYLAKPRLNAQGQPLDPQQAKRQGYEDLLWALMNTKEFLFNH
ncbi:DUF1549 and DUF1553 domain-containing protein [Planctomicrobium piriforme]|uniref:DUF1549 and DUF1553 domain-containing protein n=1 Tax=Planctomicrobium piriforme TaxID=1576369 RepID=UPI001FE4FC21|nr:DUF1549 and DUF1553 domain-containing protein [Planctomicrobium piriforme]